MASSALGADGDVAGGISPRVIAGVPVFVEVAWQPQGLWGPTLRAGFERASSGAIDLNGPSATFVWTIGSLEGCPLRWSYGPIALEPCVRAEAGILEGKGGNIVPERDATRPWFALDAVGRARWWVWRPLFVDLDAGLRVPFTRTTYFFEPNTTIYQPPPVGWFGGAGLGVRFL